jgi:hypothetical protein
LYNLVLCKGSDEAIETSAKAEVEVFNEHFVVSWALWRQRKAFENDVLSNCHRSNPDNVCLCTSHAYCKDESLG